MAREKLLKFNHILISKIIIELSLHTSDMAGEQPVEPLSQFGSLPATWQEEGELNQYRCR